MSLFNRLISLAVIVYLLVGGRGLDPNAYFEAATLTAALVALWVNRGEVVNLAHDVWERGKMGADWLEVKESEWKTSHGRG